MIRIQKGEKKQSGEKFPKVGEAAESPATQDFVGIETKLVITTQLVAPYLQKWRKMTADPSLNTQEEGAAQGWREEQIKEERHTATQGILGEEPLVELKGATVKKTEKWAEEIEGANGHEVNGHKADRDPGVVAQHKVWDVCL